VRRRSVPATEVVAPARRTALALAALVLGVATMQAQEAAGPPRTVTGLSFDGNHALDDYTLSAAIATSNSSWNYYLLRPLFSWMPFGDRRPFDELEFRRDVVRLLLFYRQHGYYDARIDTVVRRPTGEAKVTFRITEGPPVVVDSVAVLGLDSTMDAHGMAHNLPLRVGAPFDRFLFDASADTLISWLRNRGHPFAAVYRSYSVDRVSRLARVEYQTDLGPLARVGEVRVEGNHRVGVGTVRHSLALREGDVYRQDAVFESQRALYQSDLFSVANVGVSLDSLVGGQDSLVRLRVQVTEAPVTQIQAAAGYGTIDCFRVSSTARMRGFLGSARLLDLTGRLSKIGADTTHVSALCPALKEDDFSHELNYLLNATLTQPAPIGTRSQFEFGYTAERRSEFQAYLFQSVGGSVALRMGFGRRVPTSLTYRLAKEQTVAEQATYCIYFNQCDTATTNRLQEPVRNGSVTASATWTTADSPIEPTRGHTMSLAGTLAAKALGSEVVFSRLLGEAVTYQRLGRRRTLALRLRAGIVHAGVGSFGGTDLRYIPPSDRFYLGGPNTVRGYGLNQMGPQVYVFDALQVDSAGGRPDTTFVGLRSSPTGSNAFVLTNVELRLPTPIWAGRIALAAYVDGAQLWQELVDSTRDVTFLPGGFRVTPGLGISVSTPLGPMRLDAAYNGYGSQEGPLYQVDPSGSGDLIQNPAYPTYRRQPGATFLSRIQWHFSVGLSF
jgi:outer membrane protein assembly complex protein YaeT